MMKSVKLAAVVLTIALTGCASGPQKMAEKETEQRQEQAVKKVKNVMSDIPSWYLELPKSDDAIYAAATETSRDLQWAIDKANTSAVRTVAFKLKSEVSAKIKDFTLDAGLSSDDKIQREIERVSTQTALAVDVSGYQRVASVVEREGDRFRVYVLLKLPLGEANKVLAHNLRKSELLSNQVRQSKAFQELETEVNAEKGRAPKAVESKEVVVKPIASGEVRLLGNEIADPQVKAKVQDLYTKSDTIVIQETVR